MQQAIICGNIVMLLHGPPRLYCVGECSSKVLTGGDIDVLPTSSVGVVAKVTPAVDTRTRGHIYSSQPMQQSHS